MDMVRDQLTLVIVSYYSAKLVKQLLAQVLADTAYPVIIVDNAGSDIDQDDFFNRPGIRVLNAAGNVGYGAAANLACRYLDTPYVLLLNPDVDINAAQIAALLRCVLADDSDTLVWGPTYTPCFLGKTPPESVSWLSGCVMLFNVQRFRAMGGFDEHIFLFFEETDLCLRALDQGMQIKLCHEVCVRHDSGNSVAGSVEVDDLKNWHYGWSWGYFNKKHNIHGIMVNRKRYFTYLIKSLLSSDPRKKMRYWQCAQGLGAFMKHKSSFMAPGVPYHPSRRQR